MILHLIFQQISPHLQVQDLEDRLRDNCPFERPRTKALKPLLSAKWKRHCVYPFGHWRKSRNQDFVTAVHPFSSHISLQPSDLNKDRRDVHGATSSHNTHLLDLAPAVAMPKQPFFPLSFSFK